MIQRDIDSEVIVDRFMYGIGGLLWLEPERQRLYNTYGRFSKQKILELFPNRTWPSLKTMAKNLRVPRPGTWFTEEEDHLLVSLRLEGMKFREIAEIFKYRTKHALSNRFYRLNKLHQVN